MKPTFRVTKCAAEHLKKKLAACAKSPKQLLRLVPAHGGLAGLVLDGARAEDEVIRVNGNPILVFSPILIPVLKGATLDCANAREGPSLCLTK